MTPHTTTTPVPHHVPHAVTNAVANAVTIPASTAATLFDVIGLTAVQCDTVLQLISLAENGDVKWWTNYDYIEALHDGRGYTCTLFGACSGTGDLYAIFVEMKKLDPAHPLLKYMPALKKCHGENVAGIEGLLRDIPALGADLVWRQAVWTIYIQMYWKFAARFASKSGECSSRPGPVLKTAIGKGFMVDAAINHGGDLGSIDPILKRMSRPTEPDEKKWLDDFMNARRVMLRSGFQDLDTSRTGDRCVLWKSILDAGNAALTRPVTYGKGYWNGGGVIR